MTAVNLNEPRRADERGWGPGWPSCSTKNWVPLEVSSLHGGKVKFPNHEVVNGKYTEKVGLPGGVREEILELVRLLLHESERLGYINLHAGWCWGAACRPIKNPDGTLSSVPSNHSWALAVDLNAPENGFGASTHKIGAAMAKLWNTYGFRWGGDYSGTKDWMHFEFMGTPAQAKALTAKARKELDDVALTKEQTDALEFAIGQQRYAEGKPEPKRNGPRRRGWLFAKTGKAKASP